jgi:hypothetical protein
VSCGKVVLLDFWANWEYKDKGVVVLGINDEDSGTVKGFPIPTAIAIDPSGVIKAHHVGGRGENELVAVVRTAGLK